MFELVWILIGQISIFYFGLQSTSKCFLCVFLFPVRTFHSILLSIWRGPTVLLVQITSHVSPRCEIVKMSATKRWPRKPFQTHELPDWLPVFVFLLSQVPLFVLCLVMLFSQSNETSEEGEVRDYVGYVALSLSNQLFIRLLWLARIHCFCQAGISGHVTNKLQWHGITLLG